MPKFFGEKNKQAVISKSQTMEDGHVCVVDLFCMVRLNAYYNKKKLLKGRRDFDHMTFVDHITSHFYRIYVFDLKM